MLVEYRGLWTRDALRGSGLSDAVKGHLRAGAAALGSAKILFVRRRDRREREGVAVFVARPSESGGGNLLRADLPDHAAILDLDLSLRSGGWTEVRDPFLLVCTHGKHDACCARHGRPLADALAEQADAEWVWQSSHVGGDRFAGNVVCPREGLYFGRVVPEDAFALLDEHLAGRIHLPCYRGRSLYPFAVQAAEVELRTRERLAGLDELALTGAEEAAGRWRVRFRSARGEHELAVRVEQGPLAYLTCGADRLRHPPRYVVEPAA